MSSLEAQRSAQMQANSAKLAAIGIERSLQQLRQAACQDVPRTPKHAATPRTPRTPAEKRSSTRLNSQDRVVSYREDDNIDSFDARLAKRQRVSGSASRPVTILEGDEARLARERAGVLPPAGDSDSGDGGDATTPSRAGRVDSGKGVRLQGGKVYDSALGTSCHWCRQKTLEPAVTCTRQGCGRGGRALPKTFCRQCLRTRHGEDVAAAIASGRWVCPPCRGGCGLGCTNCCNCGPCRIKADLKPTGNLNALVKAAGFTNAHDYLISLVTGESADDIAARKLTADWGAWLQVDAAAAAISASPATCEGQAEPATQPAAKGKTKRSKSAPAAVTVSPAAEPASPGGARIPDSESKAAAARFDRVAELFHVMHNQSAPLAAEVGGKENARAPGAGQEGGRPEERQTAAPCEARDQAGRTGTAASPSVKNKTPVGGRASASRARTKA